MKKIISVSVMLCFAAGAVMSNGVFGLAVKVGQAKDYKKMEEIIQKDGKYELVCYKQDEIIK